MKKYFFYSFFAMAAVGSGYGFFYQSHNAELDNALTLTNVEAFSKGEVTAGWDTCCEPDGDGCCPGPYYWLPNDRAC